MFQDWRFVIERDAEMEKPFLVDGILIEDITAEEASLEACVAVRCKRRSRRIAAQFSPIAWVLRIWCNVNRTPMNLAILSGACFGALINTERPTIRHQQTEYVSKARRISAKSAVLGLN